MILSYCLNPDCPEPQNPSHVKTCLACGSNLILNNRYRAVKKIGKGGFGATFLTVDLSLPGNPLCVAKQLKPSSTDPEAFDMALELFEREAKTLGKLDHPQIPRLLDYFEQDKRFYLMQTWVKGKNLQQEVKQNGVFEEERTRKFLVESLEILKYIHGLRIIHRDIKPANIICREQDQRLVLIDFGAVKDQVSTQLIKNYGQTAFTQFAVGTMGFAPPEQLAMRPIYSSDIYALGATCLYLMTGKSPKDFPSDEHTGELLWREELNLSKGLEKVLAQMLEVDLRLRYKTVEEVLKDLDLVPFQADLQQGLLTATSVKKLSNEQEDSGKTENTYLSPTARLAIAIRARKARQGKTNYAANTVTSKMVLDSYAVGKRDFSKQNFSQFNFSGGQIPDINFSYCQLVQTNFDETNLRQANFYSANLNGAKFYKAYLKRVHFMNADLRGGDFRNANLKGANLTGANLKGANLNGANLENATVTNEQLERADTNWKTIFPDGKRRIW